MAAVTVIVPARNAESTLQACLDALRQEGVPGPEAELIVVDDGSTDRTACIARQAGARLVCGDGRGPASARNRGARLAQAPILVFLDADTAPKPGWLEALLAPFQDPRVVAVKGRYHTRQRSLVARFSQVEFEEKYARLERAPKVDFVDTGTAAFRRDTFCAAGGFDEQLKCAEDVDLAYRLASQGAHFVFAPRAGVEHRHAERLHQYLLKKAQFGFFRLQVYRRFPRKALGDAHTPPLWGVQIGLAGIVAIFGLLVAARLPVAGRGLTVALAAFTWTTTPLVRRAKARDSLLLAALVPALSLARSCALGAGVGLSVLVAIAQRLGPAR